MEGLFDLGVKIAKDYFLAFVVAVVLVAAGSTTPIGLFDWAIQSVRYAAFGWIAGWPAIGPLFAQVVAFLVGVWAIGFVLGIVQRALGWVFGSLRHAGAE